MGYETKVINYLDSKNIDAEFIDGKLYVYEYVDALRAEEVLEAWAESDDMNSIFVLPEIYVIDKELL